MNGRRWGLSAAAGGGVVLLIAAAIAVLEAGVAEAEGGAPDAAPIGEPVGAAGASVQELPPGVTPEMVQQGRDLFRGAGLCHTCHGQDGEGREGLGSDLTDDEWNHGSGSYEYLVERVQEGVPAQESATGVPMPPRGGAGISDAQVEAVAAYVWTLSRRPSPSRREERTDSLP